MINNSKSNNFPLRLILTPAITFFTTWLCIENCIPSTEWEYKFSIYAAALIFTIPITHICNQLHYKKQIEELKQLIKAEENRRLNLENAINEIRNKSHPIHNEVTEKTSLNDILQTDTPLLNNEKSLQKHLLQASDYFLVISIFSIFLFTFGVYDLAEKNFNLYAQPSSSIDIKTKAAETQATNSDSKNGKPEDESKNAEITNINSKKSNSQHQKPEQIKPNNTGNGITIFFLLASIFFAILPIALRFSLEKHRFSYNPKPLGFYGEILSFGGIAGTIVSISTGIPFLEVKTDSSIIFANLWPLGIAYFGFVAKILSAERE